MQSSFGALGSGRWARTDRVALGPLATSPLPTNPRSCAVTVNFAYDGLDVNGAAMTTASQVGGQQSRANRLGRLRTVCRAGRAHLAHLCRQPAFVRLPQLPGVGFPRP